MLTLDQLAALRAAASAATPGPWFQRGVHLVEAKTGELSRASIAEVFHAAEDGDYIAAANPAVVLALLAHIDAQAAELERAHEARREAQRREQQENEAGQPAPAVPGGKLVGHFDMSAPSCVNWIAGMMRGNVRTGAPLFVAIDDWIDDKDIQPKILTMRADPAAKEPEHKCQECKDDLCKGTGVYDGRKCDGIPF